MSFYPLTDLPETISDASGSQFVHKCSQCNEVLSSKYDTLNASCEPLILNSSYFKGPHHVTLYGDSDGYVTVLEHGTGLKFSFRMQKSTVEFIHLDSTKGLILFLQNSCLITVPIETIESVVTLIASGAEVNDLPVNLSVSIHFHIALSEVSSSIKVLDKPQTYFDTLVDWALSLSNDESNAFSTSDRVCFVADTKVPFLSFYEGQPEGSMSHFRCPHWIDSGRGLCYVWNGSRKWTVKKIFGLADLNRAPVPTTFVVSSDQRLATLTDDQSRISLVDLHRGITLRFWKGYKEAHSHFVDVMERFPPAGRLPRSGRFLLIFTQRSKTLELWSLTHGPLLKSWSVGGSLRFLPEHASTLTRSLKHYNALFVVGEEYLVGLRLSLDLSFPRTPEAADYKEFSRLRNWVCSKAFRARLESRSSEIFDSLSVRLTNISSPDWLLKAVWVLLRTHSLDVTIWLAKQIPQLELLEIKDAKAKKVFVKHLQNINEGIEFFQKLCSSIYAKQSPVKLSDPSNPLIEPVAEFFPSGNGSQEKSPKAPSSWNFFRALAMSWIFFPQSSNHGCVDKCASYERLLGEAIFAPYFAGTVAPEAFIEFLENASWPFVYFLILASRYLVSHKALPPNVGGSGLTDLAQRLFSRHPTQLNSAFPFIYEIVLSSHNYAASLVICAALVGAAETGSRVQKANGRHAPVVQDRRNSAMHSQDSLQASVPDLRRRISQLQEMTTFAFFLYAFRLSFDVPVRTARSYSVKYILKRGIDHFTSEFARCVAASELKGAELSQVYRRFAIDDAETGVAKAFRVLWSRLPHSLEVNRILVCAAWWHVRRIASPWSSLDRFQRCNHLERITDLLAATSNSGHSIAFVVALQCFNEALQPLLKRHFEKITSGTWPTTFMACVERYRGTEEQSIRYLEALRLAEFFNQFRRVSITAIEDSPLHRDAGWEVPDEVASNTPSSSTFPLNLTNRPADDAPSIRCLELWFELLTVYSGLLLLGCGYCEATTPDFIVQLLSVAHAQRANVPPPMKGLSKDDLSQPAPPSPTARQLMRRTYTEWLLLETSALWTCTSRPASGISSNDLTTALVTATTTLATEVWDLTPDLVKSLRLMALYETWADAQAEELVRGAPLGSSVLGNLFLLLMGRIRLLDGLCGGKVTEGASGQLKGLLECLPEIGTTDESQMTPSSVVPRKEGAPSLAEQVRRAQRLVALLLDQLPPNSEKRVTTEEIGRMLKDLRGLR